MTHTIFLKMVFEHITTVDERRQRQKNDVLFFVEKTNSYGVRIQIILMRY